MLLKPKNKIKYNIQYQSWDHVSLITKLPIRGKLLLVHATASGRRGMASSLTHSSHRPWFILYHYEWIKV